jgi:uncharacterized protein (TIGR02147 family)
MTKKNNIPEVFEYTEYRSYLKDWFEMQKPVTPYLSFRYLARKTGVDAGYLVRVFQGSKHLNENAIQRVYRFNRLFGAAQ